MVLAGLGPEFEAWNPQSRPGEPTPLVLKGVLPPILYCLLLRVLTYSVILTEGVLLPTDWLYETFDPWKTLSPVGGERKPEAERCGYAALSARSLIRNSVCTCAPQKVDPAVRDLLFLRITTKHRTRRARDLSG